MAGHPECKQDKASDRRLSQHVTHQFFIHELLDTHVAQLAAIAGVLDAIHKGFLASA